jgi:hypothetical protein
MELNDLSHDEQLALVGLVEYVGVVNVSVTDEEVDEIERIVDELGFECYGKLADEADQRFPDEETFRKFLQTIERQSARELIYGTVLETALSDADTMRHADLLEWLSDVWKVPVEVESD